MNERHIFIRHEIPETSPGLLVFIGILLALASLSIGVVLGFETRDYIQKQHDKQVQEEAKFKPRPTARPAPQLIPCTPEGRLEHDRVCRHRIYSARIGQ